MDTRTDNDERTRAQSAELTLGTRYRKGSFEAKMDELLPQADSFELVFFELWRESEGGWSVNDGWKLRRDSRESAISSLRLRWEVFKYNYLSKARVQDITDIGFEDDCKLEVDCTAFADVRVVKAD